MVCLYFMSLVCVIKWLRVTLLTPQVKLIGPSLILQVDKLHSRSRDNYFLNTYPVQKRSQNLLNQTCAYFLDVNECISSDDDHHLAHNCHADANCTNTKGSFYCNCHTGYSGDGVTCSGNYGFLVVYVILFIFHVL